ncbi:signal peptidase I [Chungangia koreensis]|uniref:Signal peptidase I n=1 Tax=Chungangia koreensis TaxID=752657 RepID=A0ABV8X121_9LACT
MKCCLNLVLGTGLLLLLAGCSSNIGDAAEKKVITDKYTKETIEYVEAGDNTFVIEYHIDNMDRGYHNFVSYDGKSKTVLEKTNEVQRGDIVYFKYPEDDGLSNYNPDYYLARVVGLPGETVELRDGHIYIDEQKLDTFYGYTQALGRNMDEWFELDKNSDAFESFATEKDFKINTEPITVPKTSVFVVSDYWMRGTSSIDFGPIEVSKIEGKVLGYLKEN